MANPEIVKGKEKDVPDWILLCHDCGKLIYSGYNDKKFSEMELSMLFQPHSFSTEHMSYNVIEKPKLNGKAKKHI